MCPSPLLWHTDSFPGSADPGLEPSAAPAFLLLSHIFQDLGRVDVDCGDKKEPELLNTVILAE